MQGIVVEYQADIPAIFFFIRPSTIAACQQNVDFTQVKTFINIFLFFLRTWARQRLAAAETKPGRIAEEKATTAAAAATCYYIYYYFAIQTK